MNLDESKTDPTEVASNAEHNGPKGHTSKALSLTISYCLKSNTPDPNFDALAFYADVARHSREICKLLKRSAKSDAIHGTSPCISSDSASVELKMDPSTEGGILDAGMKVQEVIWSFMADIEFITECASTGALIAERIASGELTGPVRFAAPRPGQKKPVEVDGDSNICLLRAQVSLKPYKKLLQIAGELAAQGVKIAMQCGHRKASLPVISASATKPEWIATEQCERTCVPTGFLPSTRMLELVVDGESEILAAPECASELVRQAIKMERALRVELETSQPSNPFLPDEPRLRLLRVISVTDAPGQAQLDLAGSELSVD